MGLNGLITYSSVNNKKFTLNHTNKKEECDNCYSEIPKKMQNSKYKFLKPGSANLNSDYLGLKDAFKKSKIQIIKI